MPLSKNIFFLTFLLIMLTLLNISGICGELENLTDRKWILTDIQYGGMDKDDLSHRGYFLIFHYNYEMTYKLDSNPGKIQIAAMTNNNILYKYIKSDEQTYNGKVAEKVYQLLIKAQRYTLSGDTLDLISDFGYIRFMAQPFKDSGLSGTWILNAYTNIETENQIKTPDKLRRPIKLHFNDDGTNGTADGITEFNEIKSKYELTDTNIIKFKTVNIPPKVEKNEWNEKFWEIIKFTSSYVVKNDILQIFYYENKEYMEFQLEEEQK